MTDKYELQLLRGKPIQVGFFTVYPLTLDEIVELGEERYQELLNLIFFDPTRLDFTDKPELQELSSFVLYSLILMQEEKLRKDLQFALKIFLKEDFRFHNGIFLNSKNQGIVESSWIEIKEILSLQNGLKVQEEEYRPKNKKAEEFIEKMKKIKEEVHRLKSKKEDIITFSDLISAYCAKNNNVNIFNVWDLTYYQFQNQLQRIQVVEGYDISIRSVLAGADAKKIEIKHWISKI